MKKKLLLIVLAFVCSVACSLGLAACFNNKPAEHAHVWSQEWECDETHHWHDCTASGCTLTDNSQKDGYAEHDFSVGACVCGYKPNYTVGLEYKSNDQGYTVVGIGSASDSEIVIPTEYNGKPVTEIDDSAFRDCGNITTVTVPDGVTSIGRYAFSGCDSLERITLPSDITSIDVYTFSGCSSLKSVNIPDSITNIGWNAFEDCGSLESIELPDGLPYISASTFSGCGSLKSVTIPETVTVISNSAFEGCSSLNSVTIPEAVTNMGNSVFKDCSSLTSITIPSGVKKLYFSAFEGCSSLTNLTVQGSETDIDGMTVFEGCPIETATIPSYVCAYIKNAALKTVVITSGERIYNNALENCGNLTSMTIPDSIKYIGDEAFINCKSLTSITYNGTKEQWYEISVGSNWSYNTGDFTVHCTNGDIEYN